MIRVRPVFLLLLLSACTKKQECVSSDCLEFHPIHLRVENTTSYDFTSLEVSPGTGEMHDYGILASGDTSAYFLYNDGGFHYGTIRAITNANDTFALFPIDYAGETPLEGGYYTYVLSGSNGSFWSSFRED